MGPSTEYRFDGWTFHERSGDLLKAGIRTRLQSQPLIILRELLQQPGEPVTRGELIGRLWPKGVVDYDTALNSAVRRLRGALGDCADHPRYIETIPKHGYRFIGRLEGHDAPAVRAMESAVAGAANAARLRPGWSAAAAVLLAVAAVAMLSSFRPAADRSTDGGMDAGASGQARESYLLAQHFYHRRTPEDLVLARRYFEDALAVDPRHARAWAGLASAYWIETVEGRLSDAEGLPRVREAAQRALAIDANLAEAHLRLAGYRWRSGDRHLGDLHFEAALQLEPEHPLALSIAAGKAAENGRLDEAIELQRRSVEADPLMLASRWNLATWLYLAGRLPEAQGEYLRLRELNAAGEELATRLADVLILEKRYGEALELTSEMSNETDRLFAEALAYHGLGRKADSDAALRALLSSMDEHTVLRFVEALAYRGERERAFDWLQATTGQYRADPWIRFSPFLRPLQTDPRWDAWVRTGRSRDAGRTGAGSKG